MIVDPKNFKVVHGYVIAVGLVLGVMVWSPGTLFTYHPLFMVLGYGLLMTEGILASRYIKSRERKSSIKLHVNLQLAGYFLALLGFLVIVYNKYSRERPHFQSYHSLLGLFGFLGTTAQVGVGVAIYYLRPALLKKYGVSFVIKVGRLHAFSGNITHGVSMGSMALGFLSNWSYATFLSDPVIFGLILAVLSLAAIGLFVTPDLPAPSSSGRKPRGVSSPSASSSSTSDHPPPSDVTIVDAAATV
eukprot:TRINITY_DN16825_c0_g1_i1.p1 TRINITY_DN16825_c0_g1~~TRINITY_DN16825_c0_g1_i1.p1  ORF type:complete len:274 (+),score=72.77 TRINITY_DN16825_c0_g1_i1:88-822(+)